MWICFLLSASGPTDIELSGVNRDKLTVKGLHIDEAVGSPTLYEFMLTVVDYANLTDNDTVFITYRKGNKLPLYLDSTVQSVLHLAINITLCILYMDRQRNAVYDRPAQQKMCSLTFFILLFHLDPQTPPVASAGPPVTITLPQDTVSLDGSKSADDFGIESYQWVRSTNSPAAGVSEIIIPIHGLHLIFLSSLSSSLPLYPPPFPSLPLYPPPFPSLLLSPPLSSFLPFSPFFLLLFSSLINQCYLIFIFLSSLPSLPSPHLLFGPSFFLLFFSLSRDRLLSVALIRSQF